MREIKFRAWDNENHEMIYQYDNTTKQNGIMEAQFSFDDMGVSIFTRNYNSMAWNEIKSFELMQSTGLKDKNGKEIWEGDIVEKEGQTSIVISEDGAFWVGGTILLHANTPNKVEIIGSIHDQKAEV